MSDPAPDPASFDPLLVTREVHDGGGAYSYPVAGAMRPAVLTWQDRGDVRVVDHTFVPPEARGQGLAMRLVEAIVGDAQVEGFRIAPLCPYVVTAFGRHPEWEGVRAPLPR